MTTLVHAARPTAVVFNAGAGKADAAAEFRESLSRDPLVQIVELDADVELSAALLTAIRSGVERVIAAGGDGTVGAVVTALADLAQPNVVMGVIPLGTGNDFSRSLGTSLVPTEAWEICCTGAVQPVDLLEVHADERRRLAINMVTAGNTGLYLDALTDDVKRRWGPFCYVRGVVELVRNLTPFEGQIEVDGQPLAGTSWLNLFIANGRYSGGGLQVCERAQIGDGKFDVAGIAEGTPVDVATLAGEYLWGQFETHALVSARQGMQFRLQSELPWPCTADGETFEARSLSIRLLPGALLVVGPIIKPETAA